MTYIKKVAAFHAASAILKTGDPAFMRALLLPSASVTRYGSTFIWSSEHPGPAMSFWRFALEPMPAATRFIVYQAMSFLLTILFRFIPGGRSDFHLVRPYCGFFA